MISDEDDESGVTAMAGPSGLQGIRKRTEVTHAMKAKICRIKVKNPKMTIKELAVYLKEKHGADIGKSTISDTLRRADLWLKYTDDHKSTRLPKFSAYIADYDLRRKQDEQTAATPENSQGSDFIGSRDTPIVVGKRKRTAVSYGMKKKMCLLSAEHPYMSMEDILEYMRTEHGLDIGRSTLWDTLNNSSKWLSYSEDNHSTRTRTPASVQLEGELSTWIKSHKIKLTDAEIIAHAKKIGKGLMSDSFSYSKNWLQRFKARWKIPIRQRTKRSEITKYLVNVANAQSNDGEDQNPAANQSQFQPELSCDDQLPDSSKQEQFDEELRSLLSAESLTPSTQDEGFLGELSIKSEPHDQWSPTQEDMDTSLPEISVSKAEYLTGRRVTLKEAIAANETLISYFSSLSKSDNEEFGMEKEKSLLDLYSIQSVLDQREQVKFRQSKVTDFFMTK